MKKILFIITVILSMQAKHIAAEEMSRLPNCSNMYIDNLKYIYAYLDPGSERYVCRRIADTLYAHSDSLCKRITDSYYLKQQEIIPCLIEKIKDTTFARDMYEGAYNYTVSDIAIDIIGYLLFSNFKFRVRDHFQSLFGKKREQWNAYHGTYEQVHFSIFIRNTPKENYENRIIFYNTVKKFYEENTL